MSILDYTPYRISDWVQLEHLRWNELSKNPRAIKILEQNIDKIDCHSLLENPQALLLIEELLREKNSQHQKFCFWKVSFSKRQRKLFWRLVSQNPQAIDLIEANVSLINWKWLSRNPNAIHLLEQNQSKIHWRMLSSNPQAIHLLESNIDKTDWRNLCENPNAIPIIQQHLHLFE